MPNLIAAAATAATAAPAAAGVEHTDSGAGLVYFVCHSHVVHALPYRVAGSVQPHAQQKVACLQCAILQIPRQVESTHGRQRDP